MPKGAQNNESKIDSINTSIYEKDSKSYGTQSNDCKMYTIKQGTL